MYIKAQFESQKYLQQTTFETLKYLQQIMLWNSLFSWKCKILLNQKVTNMSPFLWATSSFLKVTMGIQKKPNRQKTTKFGHPADETAVK